MADLDEIKKEILNTIYPKNTHMDFNISVALKLASKGKGYIIKNGVKEEFVTSAKIILSG